MQPMLLLLPIEIWSALSIWTGLCMWCGQIRMNEIKQLKKILIFVFCNCERYLKMIGKTRKINLYQKVY